MIILPMSFDDMPHTYETEELIYQTKWDDIPYAACIQHLRDSQLLAVFDSGQFCGFYLEDTFKDYIEVHCFVYKSCRRVSIKLMNHIKNNAKKRGLFIKTSVMGSFDYIAKYLKLIGFRETHKEKDYGTVGGNLVDLTHLSNKEDC